MNTRIKIFLAAAALVFVGAGCQTDAPPPQAPQEQTFDVSKTSCQEIAAARQTVNSQYQAQLDAIGDAYAKARAEFQSDLNSCLGGLWKGGPCDAEWKGVQDAYQVISADISNDEAYRTYKSAQAKWNECYANWESRYQEWAERNKNGEARCQEEFQAKVDIVQSARQTALDAAKKKREADLAFLDELEKKCKQQPPATNTTTGSVGGSAVATGSTTGTGTGGTGTNVTPPRSNPNAPVCQQSQTVPGENASPRQGRASDFGPKDIIINLATQVAEEVTKTPLPTSAIDDKIFAGIVCTKLYARILELHYEELDATGRAATLIRQKIARYERAKAVWCTIAQGKPALPQVKQDVAQINAMPTGACVTAADCGNTVCCSGTEVGQWQCVNGACKAGRNECPQNRICGGTPARCIAPPRTVRALRFGTKLLPEDQLAAGRGPECDEEEHWHAKAGSVRATDGTVVIDPGECGFGKTSAAQFVTIEVQGQ